MQTITALPVELDAETAALVQALALEGPDRREAVACHVKERLCRLAEEARLAGATRQTFQRIASARRLLGDPAQERFGVLIYEE